MLSNRMCYIAAFICLYFLYSTEAFGYFTLLPAPRINQRGRTCWAATATTVMSLYDVFPDDRAAHGGDSNYMGLCEAVNIHGRTQDGMPDEIDCCGYWHGEGSETPEWCTHGGSPDVLLDWAELEYSTTGVLSQAQLDDDVIDNQKPVLAHWVMDGDTHWVTIVGFDNTYGDVCIMNGWSSEPMGGFWCVTYSESLGGEEESFIWDASWRMSQSRNSVSEIEILNAPELPSGAVSPVTPLRHEDDWYYYIPDGGYIEMGPYIIDGSCDVGIGVGYTEFSNIVLNPGFRAGGIYSDSNFMVHIKANE